jgi:uncharacterized membrane protein YczE
MLIVGLFVMTVGVVLITRSDLGTPPISAVPYVLSLALPFSYGEVMIAFNALLVVVQWPVLRGRFGVAQWLQLVVGTVFGVFIDVSMVLFTWLDPGAYWQRLVVLLIGCVVLAAGIVLEVRAGLAMNPGEGLVAALALRTRREFSALKIAFDVSLVILATGLSLAILHGLVGVREGTVISALLVGLVIRVITALLPSHEG